MLEQPAGEGRIQKVGPVHQDLHPLGSVQHGRAIRCTFDGQQLTAFEGETVAAALLAAGRRTWRFTSRRGEPRGLFCGMGICFDCVMRIDGRPNVRACQTLVQDGMRVETQRDVGHWDLL